MMNTVHEKTFRDLSSGLTLRLVLKKKIKISKLNEKEMIDLQNGKAN